MTDEQKALLDEIAKLKADNAALRESKAKSATLTLKVSEKGGVSLYGMGRFPVTLYREQWEKLIAHSDTISAFLKAHSADLKAKGDAPKASGTEAPKA